MIVISDNKKMMGAWVLGQADNLPRGPDTTKMLDIPLVCILSCSDAKLDEQKKIYLNRRGGGTPFYRNSKLDQLGAPITVGIYGTNPAGGGYHATSPTVLAAHEKADMAIGGAGIAGSMDSKPYIDLKGTQGMVDATRKMKNDPPGSVSIYYNMTGFFCEVYAEEFDVLNSIKKYMDYMPTFNPEFFRVDAPKAPVIQDEELYDIVSCNTHRTYDIYNVPKALFDGGESMECKKDYGPGMITGIVKIDGLPINVITDRRGVLAMQGYPSYPEYRGKGAMGMGGRLYRQGLIKMNEFMTLCGCDRPPVIWVQDMTGIDIGNEAEKAELPDLSQSLTYSIQSAKLPMFGITLRGGTVVARYVLGDPQGNDDNVFSIGTVATKINVMYSETVAGVMYSRRLVKDRDSGKDLQGTIDKMNQLIQHYIDTSTPAYCAKVGLIDEIVDMPKIRDCVVAFANAAYQNPRSIYPACQMILPRIIKDYDGSDQNTRITGAGA